LVQINTSDYWTHELLPLNEDLARNSQIASLRSESDWQAYLNASGSLSLAHQIRSRALLAARRIKLLFNAPPESAVKRLINIELSHRDLWARGLDSGMDWILILEDDAGCQNIDDLVDGILGLIRTADPNTVPDYVNISESFAPRELGIDGILRPSGALWAGFCSRQVLAATRPVTNTACAILYRRSFLADLVADMDKAPMSPVIPIDFKLNESLMRLFGAGRLRSGSCWQVEPAPIVQMSMHSME
jgi:hypothetical protein